VIEPSVFQSMVNIIRYTKMHIVFLTQGVRLLPANIREACSVVFAKRMNDTREFFSLSQIISSDPRDEKKQQFVMGMDVSDEIFINKEQYAVPVHIIIPEYPTQKISDELIHEQLNKNINQLLVNVRKRRKSEFSENKNTDEENLKYQEKIILEDLKKFPFDFQHERCNRLDMNSKHFTENLENLTNKTWLRKHDTRINLGKGKGQFQLYLFTDKTIEKIGKQNIVGKGGLEHSFWQNRVAKYYNARGYKTEIEHFLTEDETTSKEHNWRQSVDVTASKKSEKIAVEIELNNTKQIKQNIEKLINTDYVKIIIAAYGRNLLKQTLRVASCDALIEKELRSGRLKIIALQVFLEKE